ncbi:MAG: hypothetical protein ACO1PI_06740 [Bacteroidota bacterium]
MSKWQREVVFLLYNAVVLEIETPKKIVLEVGLRGGRCIEVFWVRKFVSEA